MIVLLAGTRVVYTKANGDKIEGTVIDSYSYDDDEAHLKGHMLVQLDCDDRPAVLSSTTLEIVDS